MHFSFLLNISFRSACLLFSIMPFILISTLPAGALTLGSTILFFLLILPTDHRSMQTSFISTQVLGIHSPACLFSFETGRSVLHLYGPWVLEVCSQGLSLLHTFQLKPSADSVNCHFFSWVSSYHQREKPSSRLSPWALDCLSSNFPYSPETTS